MLIFFLIFKSTDNPIEPTTPQQVAAALKAHGYEPVDATAKRQAERSAITSAVEVREGDFYFAYISCSDSENALGVSQNFYSWLRLHRYSVPCSETEESMANYSLYSIKVSGTDKYTVRDRVGNTVIYAESNIEDSEIVKQILSEVGYFQGSASKTDAKLPIREKGIIFLVFFIAFLFAGQFTSSWLWEEICLSAGKSPTAVAKYRKESQWSDKTPNKISAWLKEGSDDPIRTHKLLTIYRLCKLPTILCIILSIISLFTGVMDKVLTIGSYCIIGLNIIMMLSIINQRSYKDYK